jgi:8-oxo-dGTP diphosphatase
MAVRHTAPSRHRSYDRAIRNHLLRHACAGHKQEWPGYDDDERPLDPAGVHQAEALADALAGEEVRRLVASPARRCVDTLEPLARRLGLPVETSTRLSADADVDALLVLLADPLLDGAVLCTQGEAMEPLLEVLRSQGASIVAERTDDDWLLGKGTAWSLVIEDRRVVSLTHVAPVPVTACPRHLGGP